MKNTVAVILGSGLNNFKKELTNPVILSESDEGFHKIEILAGKIGKKDVILFTGRKHIYEGYRINEVLENVINSNKYGVNFLIITNAAGGLNPNFQISDLMLITSHLNINSGRITFTGNKNIYNKNILTKIKLLAQHKKKKLRTGYYCSTYGPAYETKSEIRMLRKLGIDAVGMSTIPEILYSAETGIHAIGISCITNILTESHNGLTEHAEVVKAGKESYNNFSGLLKLIIKYSGELIK